MCAQRVRGDYWVEGLVDLNDRDCQEVCAGQFNLTLKNITVLKSRWVSMGKTVSQALEMFNFACARNLVSGVGSSRSVLELASKLGSNRPLIVTDKVNSSGERSDKRNALLPVQSTFMGHRCPP